MAAKTAVPKLLVVGGNGFLGKLIVTVRDKRSDDQDRRFVKLPSPRDGRYLVSGRFTQRQQQAHSIGADI